MTDNEITKALECCATEGKCSECPANPHRGNYGFCTAPLIKASYDLINRQRAEIERLNAMVEAAENYLYPLPFKNAFDEEIEKAKAEAIKEFAERVTAIICENTYPSFDKDGKAVNIWKAKVGYDAIDNLVKEMVGEG